MVPLKSPRVPLHRIKCAPAVLLSWLLFNQSSFFHQDGKEDTVGASDGWLELHDSLLQKQLLWWIQTGMIPVAWLKKTKSNLGLCLPQLWRVAGFMWLMAEVSPPLIGHFGTDTKFGFVWSLTEWKIGRCLRERSVLL